MALALFDLDETLLAGDSDYEWGLHLVSLGKVDGNIYKNENERFYREYQAGKLDVDEFLSFALKPLAENSYEELLKWREDYIEQRIKPIIKPKAYDLISSNTERPATILVIVLQQPIAFITRTDTKDIFGMHRHINCNRTCNRKWKLYWKSAWHTELWPRKSHIRLQEWLELDTSHSLEGSYFYSDSRNDIPLLELSQTTLRVQSMQTKELTANTLP